MSPAEYSDVQLASYNVTTNLQEETIARISAELSQAHQDLAESQQEVASMTDAAKKMQVTQSSLTGKLRTCKQQLEGNEQMIRWLNSQVGF